MVKAAAMAMAAMARAASSISMDTEVACMMLKRPDDWAHANSVES